MENQAEKLSKKQIIESFQKLLHEENCIQKKDEVRNLREEFKALSIEEEKAQRAAFEAKENNEEGERFEFVENELDAEFKALNDEFKNKIKTLKEEVAKAEKQNFAQKTALIKELQELVDTGMQNVGEAFKKFYDIQENWNNIGPVNKSQFKQLQFDYSHYRDLFYHNVNIHHQLKDYDFKKNGELKKAITEDLKALLNQDSIKKMESEIKELQSKWDSIGPTTNEQWESLKNEYWDTVNAIYEKIKIHYKALKEAQAAAFNKKHELTEKIKNLSEEVANYSIPKHWAALTDKVNKLHKEWKEAGFSGKQNEDVLWTDFKSITDDLRNRTNTFFEKLKAENVKAENAKKAFIAKAEELKSSKDWQNTSKALIQLQKEWKNTGRAAHKIDQKLWEQFRAACDFFFNAKQEFYDTLDDRQEANLKEKNAIADKIKQADSEEVLNKLIGEWHQVGFIPKNEIAKANDVFDKAINSAATTLNIAQTDLNQLKFTAKIAAFKNDENGDAKLKSEKQFIQTQIDNIKEELLRFEENMAYFGPSKGAQKLKEVVENKMEASKEKLKDWQMKLKMLKS